MTFSTQPNALSGIDSRRNMHFQGAIAVSFLQCDHLITAKGCLIKGKRNFCFQILPFSRICSMKSLISVELIVSALMKLLVKSAAVMESSAVEISSFCSPAKHISKQISEDVIST